MLSAIEEIFSEDSLPPGETDEGNFQCSVELAEKAKIKAEKDFEELLTQKSKRLPRINIKFLFD